MSYRIFMLINRGMTDETAVCVFPWEKPLLEEVHGAGAIPVTVDEMCSTKGVKNVRAIPMPTASAKERVVEKAPDLRQQLEAMVRVDPEVDPFEDLDQEYGRLIERYGMHPKVEMPIVEKVFGSTAAFKRMVQPYRGSKPPKFDPIDGVEESGELPDDDDGDKAPVDMSRDELKAALKERGIQFNGNAKTDELVELLTEAIAQPA